MSRQGKRATRNAGGKKRHENAANQTEAAEEEKKEVPPRSPSTVSKSGKICSVCYETIKEQGVIESCEHTFCYKCISTWAQVQSCLTSHVDGEHVPHVQEEVQSN